MSKGLYVLPTGRKRALYGVAFALLCYLFDLEALGNVALLFSAAVLYIYRIPRKKYDLGLSENVLVAPVSGVIKEIKEMRDETFGYEVTIESSVLENGAIYVPMPTDTIESHITRGTRLSKNSRLFDKLNETIAFRFHKGMNEVETIHRLKRSPFDVEHLNPNEKTANGSICGFAHNCVTTIYVPCDFRFNVKKGDRIKAPEQILGYFKE